MQQTLRAAADPTYPFSHALDLLRVADLVVVRSSVGHLAADTLKVILPVVIPNGRASHTSKTCYPGELVSGLHKAKYCFRVASGSSLQSHKHW